MPAILIVDSSLSMSQSIETDSGPKKRFEFALYAMQTFLQYQQTHNPLDLTSLITCSRDQTKVLTKFTRDYKKLFQLLNEHMIIDNFFDHGDLLSGLRMVKETLMEMSVCNVIYQVLVFTSGNAVLQSLNQTNDDNQWPLPMPVKSKIHFICISSAKDHVLRNSLPFLMEIIARNSNCEPTEIGVNTSHLGGQIWVSNDSLLSNNAIEQIIHKLTNDHFKPFLGKIVCGNLSCSVQIFPRFSYNQHNGETRDVNKAEISLCGFILLEEVASPPVVSRHLITPITESSDLQVLRKSLSFINLKDDLTDTELNNLFEEDTQQPSFGILLYNSFKASNMAALCQLGPDCFGILYAGTDVQKKSCLMFSLFEPGFNSVPWLAKFSSLGLAPSSADYSTALTSTGKRTSPNYLFWMDKTGLQNDLQKVMRYLRKLPDKQDMVYLEAKRIRRIAAAFNYYEPLDLLVQLFEREVNVLQATHPEVAAFIQNLINFLRQPFDNAEFE